MSEAPAPDLKPDQQQSRHGYGKHSSSRTGGVPRVLYAVIVLSVAALAVLPLARYMGWTRPKEVAALKDAPPKQADLVLPEVSLVGDGDRRHIAGSVQNISKKRYENVELTFSTRDKLGRFVAYVSAKVTAVEPDGRAKFETEPLPAEAVRMQVTEITGTPH